MAGYQHTDQHMFGIKGSEGHDPGALTPGQQTTLNQYKITTRIDNEKYLRNHPEVSCLLTGFLESILQQRPSNVREFSANYFSDSALKDQVALHVMELRKKLDRS